MLIFDYLNKIKRQALSKSDQVFIPAHYLASASVLASLNYNGRYNKREIYDHMK